MIRDPDDPERRYFKQCKCNNGPDQIDAVAFRVESRTLANSSGPIETAIPVFEEQLCVIDLGSMMNGHAHRGPKPVKSSQFAEWIWEKLQGGDPIPIKSLIAGAQDQRLLPLPVGDEKISLSPFYNALDRIPELHPGWKVKQETVEVESGGYLRVRKACRLVRAGDEIRLPDGTDKAAGATPY